MYENIWAIKHDITVLLFSQLLRVNSKCNIKYSRFVIRGGGLTRVLRSTYHLHHLDVLTRVLSRTMDFQIAPYC